MMIRGLFIAAGILVLTGAVFDTDWLVAGRHRFKFLSKLDRNGKRIAYGIIAVSVIVFAILV